MGIKNFKQFLKSYAPNATKTENLSQFKGKRLAVDGHNWMYKYMATSLKHVVDSTDITINEVSRSEVFDLWIRTLSKYLINLVDIGVTPIFVIDGPPLKQKVDNVHVKRKGDFERRRERLKEINEKLEGLNPLLMSKSLIDEKKKILKTFCAPTKDEIQDLFEILSTMGIPCIKAANEAERLCTSLCIEGIAAGVISSDTDNLTFGCPVLITKTGTPYSTIQKKDCEITIIRLEEVLTESKLSFKTFIDLCIMCGCDYNNNIKGIGVKKSYVKLVDCKKIENLPSTWKIDCLNHETCRSIFRHSPSLHLLDVGQSLITDINIESVNKEEKIQILQKHHVNMLYEEYLHILKNAQTPTNTPPTIVYN